MSSDMEMTAKEAITVSRAFATFLSALNSAAAFQPGSAVLPRQATHFVARTRSSRHSQMVAAKSVASKANECDMDGAECVGDRSDSGISYRKQFEDLFSRQLDPKKPVAKPSPKAQASEPSAVKVLFSDVYGTRMTRTFFNRVWTKRDIGRAIFFGVVHGAALFAPFYFTWRMFAIQFLIYVASGMGITYSYHRQLSHKSFQSPKWFEYLGACCGMMAMQGAPLDWASEHRYHHLHTETPLDPHSIYEGFWWSHMGWLLDSKKKEERCGDMCNAKDLLKQRFYTFTSKHYKKFVIAHFALAYALGGVSGFVWRCFFVALLYHVTWFVNSASHVWGRQEYRTGDQSRNNWWVGFLAFGEGWHNNHHAFEFSARHGLRQHQFDITWIVIRLFQRLGLVTNVKLPTERARARLRLQDTA